MKKSDRKEYVRYDSVYINSRKYKLIYSNKSRLVVVWAARDEIWGWWKHSVSWLQYCYTFSFQLHIGHLHVFFEKISIHIFCPFFKCVVCFSDVELCKFFVYFEYWSFIVYIFCEYFLLFSRLFILLVVVSCPVKSFLVWYSPVCSFCSPLVSWGDILKNIAKTTVNEHYCLCFLLGVL